MTAGNEDKTIKGILIKLALIMGFILIVPGIMTNILDIDPLNGCVKLTVNDIVSIQGIDRTAAETTVESGESPCWRTLGPGGENDLAESDKASDKIVKAKIAFDEQIIGLISWGLTAFILIMVLVGFIFPGRDIIAYVRKDTPE